MADFDDARAFWDARFAAPEYIFGTEPNQFLVREASRLAPGAEVLDMACGEGRNAVWLAGRGCQVTGFDVSPLALDKARRLAATKQVQVEWLQADVRTWEWAPAAFDAVACIFIQFASPAERERLFAGFRETLRPGGLVLLQGYTPKQLEYRTGGPGEISHLYTEAMLREAFDGWDILQLREYEADLAEGTKHVGRSALIELVARRPV
jgi:cyclopropane fatty-acyl-phospholipid synthase-like methyltransferase